MISSTDMEAYLQKFLQKFQHLKIQLKDIKKATNDFNDKHIGAGGFGKVYKGEVTYSDGRGMVAIKRLGSTGQQGVPEFLKEITTLSDYKHENLISLLGYCCERDEKILVYELASHGSLDLYLNSPHLTWPQRLKICLDAAKGISYLHDPRETRRRLIHCDVKSGNILLDGQWNAKVSDFGLSTMGSANEQHSVIVTPAAGTRGYIDPLYWMTHTLTKESDVYSFGVVLFEVLCGRLCYTLTLDSKGHHVKDILVPMWIKRYEQNTLNDIIFKHPNIKPMQHIVLKSVSSIAYKCLKESREDRPEMAEVVTQLERALNIHELLQVEEFIGNWNEQLYWYQEMIKTAEPPLDDISEDKLMDLLSKGVLLNYGKTWFSLNKKGEHCEMISIADCLGSDVKRNNFSNLHVFKSRFDEGTYEYYYKDKILITHVKSQFLSPGITYTVNLVFKIPFKNTKCFCYIGLNYKLQGETENSISHMAYEIEDRRWICELYQFTSDHRTIDLQILFDGFSNHCGSIHVEGIEFRPMEKVQHKDENQPISDLDSDTNWEENMPTDYEDIMKLSENSLQWTTKEEAHSVIRKGFFISVDEKTRNIWFYLDKNGKNCYKWHLGTSGTKTFCPESRFGEAVQWDSFYFIIDFEVQSQLLSSETTYAVYLVYKFPKDQSRFEAHVFVDASYSSSGWYDICLSSPQTPVIRPKANQNTHNPVNRPKMKGFPQQRNDGWMEVQILELQTPITIYRRLKLNHFNKKFGKLIIEGIEFRPM